jgi:hypothetical protein
MAINVSFSGSSLMIPGFYGDPYQKIRMYGIVVGVRDNMSYADAQRTFRLLCTLQRFELFRNATIDSGHRSIENDNELYYRVTIWEKTNVT